MTRRKPRFKKHNVHLKYKNNGFLEIGGDIWYMINTRPQYQYENTKDNLVANHSLGCVDRAFPSRFDMSKISLTHFAVLYCWHHVRSWIWLLKEIGAIYKLCYKSPEAKVLSWLFCLQRLHCSVCKHYLTKCRTLEKYLSK